MPEFAATLQAWRSDAFASALKADMRRLQPGILPLHQAVSRGGYVDESDIEVTLLAVDDQGDSIQAHVGIFFTEIVINCGCGDDPMEENAYCEMRLRIDKATAEAEFSVMPG